MSERVCLYPGSFDPVTLGHLDIIERACALFDRVVVAVSRNPEKRGVFSFEERVEMLRLCTAHLPKVEIRSCEGLTVAFARQSGAGVLLRGLRAVSDFEGEWTLAQINLSIAPEIETLCLFGKPEHSHISSSAVREMASYGCSLAGFVPSQIEKNIWAHYAASKA